MNSSKPPIDGRRSLRKNQLATPQVKSSSIRHDLGEQPITGEASGDVYARAGRLHKRHTSDDRESGSRHDVVGDVERQGRRDVEENTRLREAYERGYERGNIDGYSTNVEILRKGKAMSIGRVRTNSASFRRDTSSLRREGDAMLYGSPSRDVQSSNVRHLGRAGSELSVARGGSGDFVIGRAASVNADLNIGRAVEFHLGRLGQRTFGHGMSDPRAGRIAASDTNIARTVTSMERDNYCSSCGEEDEDLNESLLTTTTTNSSDQTATCSSGSNSIAQECWENDIREDGSLLYISCYYNEKNGDSVTYEGNEILNRIQRQQYESHQGPSVPVSSILKPIENNRHENRIIKLIRKKSMSKKSSLVSESAAKVKKLNIEIPSATARKLKLSYIPFGEPREVIFQTSHNLNLGRRATLSEIKLGLQLDETGDQLRVIDIIPDSNVYHSKQVEVNDLLLSVNDRPVNKHNVAEVLGMIQNTGQIKLIVQATKNKHELARDKNNYKSKLVLDILNGVESAERTDMCCVYVNGNGIQYKYPVENNNLTNSFGLFLTLNNLFSNSPMCCGTSSVECDSYIIFTRDKQYKNTSSNNLLLISFPHQQFNSYDLCLKMNKLIVSCLQFMFGYEMDAVFGSNNFMSLNRLFSLLFNRLLMAYRGELSGQGNIQGDSVTNEEYIKICKVESYTPIQDGQEARTNTLSNRSENSRSLPNIMHSDASSSENTSNSDGNKRGQRNTFVESSHEENGTLSSDSFTFAFPRKLKVSMELDAQINDALGELEANDTYEDDVKDFIVAGTCLYYKQYLLTSHVNEKDLACIHNTLYCNGLLRVNSAERHVKNMILWRRVYPKSHTVDNLYYNNSLKSSNTYYLLIYGRSNFLLCSLLESNYFTNPNLNPDNTQPDVKLIRHAEEIVNFLISTRNISYLNKEISLLSLNSLDSPGPSDWTETQSLSGSYRSQSTLTDEEYGGDYRKPHDAGNLLPVRVLAGSVLFYYALVNKQEGVLFTPDRCKVSPAARDDPHEAAVFGKFQTCVNKIEKVFKNYAKFKKLNSTLNSKPVKLNRSMICIKEAGLCFEVGDTKYWTLGRLYNNVSQVYVCYVSQDESVMSQNMIEIMFKLFLSYS